MSIRDHHLPPRLLAGTALLTGVLFGVPAVAQDATSLKAIQAQIEQLQKQLKQLQQQGAERDAALKRAQKETASAQADARNALQQAASKPIAAGPGTPILVGGGPSQPVSLAGTSPSAITGTNVDRPNPTFQLGNVKITLGGSVNIDTSYRTSNLTNINTAYNSLPFENNPNKYAGEFRMNAQASKLGMLVEGELSKTDLVAAYFEGDVGNGAGGANSYNTSSYTPRVRHAYLQYDAKDLGLHVLAGQSWSLATANTIGITPRKENIVQLVDGAYVPGFVSDRMAQLRVVKDFGGKKYWIGASLETPQATFGYNGFSTSYSTTSTTNGVGTLNGRTVTFGNPNAGGGLNPQALYSLDQAPDVIVKAAADPGFGHYEIFGVGRAITDRVSYTGGGNTNTVLAGGVGADFIVPVMPSRLDLTGDVMAGNGIARYINSAFPDAGFKGDGSPAPLRQIGGYVGLVGHPSKSVDLYTYVGESQTGRATITTGTGRTLTGSGYGTSFVNTGGCSTELGSCAAQTRALFGAAVGGWWRVMQDGHGTVLLGAQYGYGQRTAFHGTVSPGVGSTPKASTNVVYFSVRYLPFQ